MDITLFHAICALDTAVHALHHSVRATTPDELDTLVEQVLAAAEAVVAASPTGMLLPQIENVRFVPTDCLAIPSSPIRR